MGSFGDKLSGIVTQIEKNVNLGEVTEIIQTTQRWILWSQSGGVTVKKSTYLLCPADINKILQEELGLDITSDDVEKFCRLAIEKREGMPMGVRLIYEFSPNPIRRTQK